MSKLYAPAHKLLWDPWFLCARGHYHLFHQETPLKPDNSEFFHYPTIGHAVSEDLRTWTPVTSPIPLGPPLSWDELAHWTGCAFEHNDSYYLFYTGRGSLDFWYQRIGLALSDDLLRWTKVDNNGLLLEADGHYYSSRRSLNQMGYPPAWRDPFVFRDPDNSERFLMTISAEDPRVPEPYNACIGLAQSKDLLSWELLPPIFSPGCFAQMEVSQVLRRGEYWYLFFSTRPECYEPTYAKSYGASFGWHGFYAKGLNGPYRPLRIANGAWTEFGTIFNMRLITESVAQPEGETSRGTAGTYKAIGWYHPTKDSKRSFTLTEVYTATLEGENLTITLA